ncbi:MAG: hypothetical protein HeimC3_11580 [Candidatus Heimdallarchaeota archaeon LC_3]|nr:MAG: hypothetical protein HeimC3_11580 [Candidatus Heimdallarchaeota archaeon LC_3]
MIEEIWVVYETKCLFARSYTDNPFKLNSQLFSGFISALLILSEEVTGTSTSIRNIELVNTRLSIIKRNLFDSEKEFILIGRSSLSIPLERVFQQLQVLSTEIKFLLENDLNSSVNGNPLSIIDIKTVQRVMEEALDPQLIQWSENNKQLALVDQITLINLISNIIEFIQEIYSVDNSFIFEIFNNNENEDKKHFVNLITNKNENKYDNGVQKEISQDVPFIVNLMREILLEFLNELKDKQLKYSKEEAKITLLNFITKNWHLIRHFQLADLIIGEISAKISK